MHKRRFLSLVAVFLLAAMLVACSPKAPAPTDPSTVPTNPTDPTDPSTPSQTVTEPQRTVKNIIYMIADGGGYDNYTLAAKVKAEMLSQGISKLEGAKTEVTANRLSGMDIDAKDGLYLDKFLVGSANTLLRVPHGSIGEPKAYITDSAAAGTALSTGNKTVYGYMGLNSDRKPVASITELARMNGMATGVVTNKSYMDATPQTFMTSHSIYRYEYQDNSLQTLYSGVDVMIGEGTEYGDLFETGNSSHPEISAYTVGYPVAVSGSEMIEKAGLSETKKLWTSIIGVSNANGKLKAKIRDTAADHISYDIDAIRSAEHPSLLQMTESALQVMENQNNENGFFLMIEGGALDNAAEGGNLRTAVGEYLAFDEAFAYCVAWASQRDDTIVIAVPDHDSGGFSGIESCEEMLIDAIISGQIGGTDIPVSFNFTKFKAALKEAGADTSAMALHNGHTDMAVPISLYAPDAVRSTLLENLGLPTEAGEIRTGDAQYYVPNQEGTLIWYKSTALNDAYTIDNTAIAPALVKTAMLGSLENATSLLFVPVGHTDGSKLTGSFGGEITYAEKPFKNSYAKYLPNTYTNGALSVARNGIVCTLDGVEKEIPKIGNAVPQAIFVLDKQNTDKPGTFYLPYSVLVDAGLAWCVSIEAQWGPPLALCAPIGTAITLPGTEGITYTDGTNSYKPGDTVTYSEISTVNLKIA